MTKEQRKQQAIKFLEKLNIYDGFIKDFKKEDTVCYFENYMGYWAFQDKELLDKIKKIEEKYNCTVYAVTHDFAEFGELYNFLIVTNYKEEWNDLLVGDKITKYAYAYVWNKTDNDCSEFGTILVKSLFGGIRRIG